MSKRMDLSKVMCSDAPVSRIHEWIKDLSGRTDGKIGEIPAQFVVTLTSEVDTACYQFLLVVECPSAKNIALDLFPQGCDFVLKAPEFWFLCIVWKQSVDQWFSVY